MESSSGETVLEAPQTHPPAPGFLLALFDPKSYHIAAHFIAGIVADSRRMLALENGQ